MGEPRGCHLEEILWHPHHGQLQKADQTLHSWPAPPIPRVDEVLDKLGTGRILSLFNLVSSFHQITVHKDTMYLTAFCTPTRLFKWLVMPQGSSAAPGEFVKVINEVIKGLDRVAAYLDGRHRLRRRPLP